MCNGAILHICLDTSDEHNDQYIIQSCQAAQSLLKAHGTHQYQDLHHSCRTQEPG